MRIVKPRGRHPEKSLTTVQVRSLSKPGRYADGNGLYLMVEPSGAKRWVLRTVVRGKRRDMGLGGLSFLVTLATFFMLTGLNLAVTKIITGGVATRDISNMDECIFRTDSSTSRVTMTNTRYSDIGDALFIGVASGNISQSNNTEY